MKLVDTTMDQCTCWKLVVKKTLSTPWQLCLVFLFVALGMVLMMPNTSIFPQMHSLLSNHISLNSSMFSSTKLLPICLL